MTSNLPKPPRPKGLATISASARNLKQSGTKSSSGSSTLDALQSQSQSHLDSRLSRVRAGAFARLYRAIPFPVLRLMPFLREDGKRLIQDLRRPRSEGKALPETGTLTPEQAPTPPFGLTAEQPSPYSRYGCQSSPLACSRNLLAALAEGVPAPCPDCGFPGLLAESAEIRGRRGRYRVAQFLGVRGLGRLYVGQDVERRQPVVIREYLLPNRHFNPTEQQLIRDTFETIAGLKLADGRDQDFRLVEPWDAIGDRNDSERCYLVTGGSVDTLPTLRSHLATQGAMASRQVRQILNQVLQTLESLHGQKYSLPTGQVQQGLVHGNLTLDSLVMQADAQAYYEQPQLLVFLRDLFLWESLFIPPPAPARVPQPADDLAALGHIGFHLLVGHWADTYGRPLKPSSSTVWPEIDLPLEQYLRQLLGLEPPAFEDAATARQALLRLPKPPATLLTPVATTAPEEPSPKRSFPKWGWLLLLGGMGLVGTLLLGWWWHHRQAVASQSPSLHQIAAVPAVPPGHFTYTATHQGIWYPLWSSENLVVQDKTLEQILESQQPELDLHLLPTADPQEAIDQVLQDKAEFAIAPLTPNRPSDLVAQPIAYDGLVVFVAFSYVERERGLPQHLQGQISLSQLRQLYTGEIHNWRELGGPDLPVKLYLPDQPELIQVFEERVLQSDDAIAAFRRQWDLEGSAANSNLAPIVRDTAVNSETLPTVRMLRRILQDFELDAPVGSIGFASLSQVSGQCSVYPLAIAADHTSAVQPIYQKDGTPISPTIDLCDDKGNYAPKHDLFVNQTYPLAYPLAVFYRLDNSRPPVGSSLVQMMATDEGQQLLGKVGLVPLRPHSVR